MAARARRGLALLLLAFVAAAAAPAAAQTVVTSAAPDSVDVTVYRDPERSPSEGLDTWLGGYALVTETRTVSLPAGESDIRFEGVAGGLIPQTVIVTGLPERIVERNRDAYLLSPGTLLDRSLGRRVTLRRTSLATGRVREMEAVIRTGSGGAVVIETAQGVEALRCTGLPETLVYSEVPADLSAKPTLSVRVRARQPVTATVTLAYLATGFDWQANYVATLAPDGTRMDLFAWLTLASQDETSFRDADTQAIAGQVNWERQPAQDIESPPLDLNCWRQSTTSDIPLQQFERTPLAPPPPSEMPDAESIVVTGSRIERQNFMSASPLTVLQAQQEDFGPLKLYRIPEPVTIASNSQKQVALLQRTDVQVETVYRRRLFPQNLYTPVEPATRYLITRNRTADGLGLPLPAGGIELFVERSGRPLLVGQSALDDHAVGQDVEIEFGDAPGVLTELRDVGPRRGEMTNFEFTVTNDRAEPIRFESELVFQRFRPATRLARRDGMPLWAVTVPAHGRAVLRFRARWAY